MNTEPIERKKCESIFFFDYVIFLREDIAKTSRFFIELYRAPTFFLLTRVFS